MRVNTSGSHAGQLIAPIRVSVDLAWLDTERDVRGWTKRRLATATGVAPETISDLYRRGFTSPGTYAKLKRALRRNPPSDLDLQAMGARQRTA